VRASRDTRHPWWTSVIVVAGVLGTAVLGRPTADAAPGPIYAVRAAAPSALMTTGTHVRPPFLPRHWMLRMAGSGARWWALESLGQACASQMPYRVLATTDAGRRWRTLLIGPSACPVPYGSHRAPYGPAGHPVVLVRAGVSQALLGVWEPAAGIFAVEALSAMRGQLAVTVPAAVPGILRASLVSDGPHTWLLTLRGQTLGPDGRRYRLREETGSRWRATPAANRS
jgi:hypothetical protein